MALKYPFDESDGLELDPTYRELRRNEPVSRVVLPYGGQAWLAVRHADVRTVLSDPRFSRAAVVGREVPRTRPELEENPNSVMNMDPPDHMRLRKFLAKAFTTRRVEALRPRAADLTAELLTGLRAAGPGSDLVEHVSVPLPLTIICELLGVPIADRPIFRSASHALVSMSTMTPQERLDATHELTAYMAGMVKQRRTAPTDDLLGALVRARDEGDRLSDGELLELAVTILVAGHETTMNQIGNMTYTLLTRPDRWQALRDDPEGVTRAVEELLRYTPLVASTGFPRVATDDVDLSGVMVHAARPSWCRLMPPTATRNFSPMPRRCGWTGRQTATSRSGMDPITALVRRWPDWNCRSSSGSCCANSRTFASVLRPTMCSGARVPSSWVRGRCRWPGVSEK